MVAVLTNNLWLESTRIASEPPVSTVKVSAAGNLIAVFVSLRWIILSAITTSLCAVMIPIESILVTSSYVRTPVNVAATPVIFLTAISGVPVNPWALVATVAVAEFPVKAPTKPPVDVVTPVTSKLFDILTFFEVVTPVLVS